MKNEKGFILPTTIIIILFCLLIVTHISTALIIEKKFYSETEQYYLLNNLMTIAVEQSLTDVKSSRFELNHQIIHETSNGNFEYRIFELSPHVFEIKLKCKTLEGNEYSASYQYDLEKNEMILWSEYE